MGRIFEPAARTTADAVAERRDPKAEESTAYFELKARIHNRLIELMDLTLIGSLEQERLRQEIRRLVERIIKEENLTLNFEQREKLFKEIQDEVLGLGPLEPFLQDTTVSDLLINGFDHIYVERNGKLERTKARFRDEEHLRKIIDKIVSAVGRRVDESSPMVDARLADGSRVNAIIPPLALDGSMLSIRRFPSDPLEIEDLIRFKTLTPEMAEILQGIVRCRLNIMISGGTGSGKTTMLNVLSRFIPADERIITIEDSAELQLKQEHVVRLETRPANIEGRGEITMRDLVKNSLRMRPDRIIVGEVRSAEVLDMLQAMNTGHDGSITAVHANTPRDALMRVETMISLAGVEIPSESAKKNIASALNVIIQVARLSDGSRKLLSVQEITGMEGHIISMQEIFSFEQVGIDSLGKVKGRFRPAGIRPRFMEKFEAFGIQVPRDLFDPRRVQEI